MKLHRLYALFLRHTYPIWRDFDILSDMLYWPFIDLLLWGITSEWLSAASGMTSAVGAFLSGLVLWNVIWRAQAEVGRNLMDEIWNNNMMNLFASPLTLVEWITGVLLLSFLKMAITLSILVPAVFFFYHFNIFHLGWWLLVFFANATLTGWALGFVSSAIVIRYGPKMQNVVWTLPGILLPFSAVYFPLEKLPTFVQPISRMIPTTYIFEAMRSVLFRGELNGNMLVLSFALNVIYIFCSLLLFRYAFRKSRELGLGRFT